MFLPPKTKALMVGDMNMDELKAVRRDKFKKLVADHGGQDAVASRLGVSQAYVSKLITGNSPFSEKSARRIEVSFSKPNGWLDEQAKGEALAELYALIEELAEGDDEEVKRIIAVIRALRQ